MNDKISMTNNQKLAFITIVLLILAAVILSVEFILRGMSPQYFCNTIRQAQYDKDLGVIPRNNLNLSMLTDHIIEVNTNDIGSRNFADQEQLLSYPRVIFCIGDSFTEGVGNMSDQSYPFYLDLMLNEHESLYRKEYAVFNLGGGAYGSTQSERIAERYEQLISRKPDIIVYFICNNDFMDDVAYQAGRRHNHMIQGNPRYSPWVVRLNEFFENWQIFYRIKKSLRDLRNAFIFRDNSDVLANQGILALENIDHGLPGLEALRRRCQERNIQLILSCTGYDTPLYDVIKKYSQINNIPFVDYRPSLLSVVSAMPSLPVNNTHSGGHFRSWVNLLFAQRLRETIESMTVLPEIS